MGKAQVSGGDSAALGSAQTRYSQVSGQATAESTEANAQITVRYANLTVTNLIVNISANSLSGGTATSTIRTRVAGANGNNSVSINNGATGQFADTSSSDSVSTGQALNYQIVSGGTSGTINYSIGCTFDSATDTFSRLCSNNGSGATYNLNATTTYFGFGIITFEGTTEAKIASRIRATMSAKNLSVRVSANARTTSTTVKSRINGADGNLTVTIGAGATGTFEDTTHTDSISSGNDYDFSILGGAETTNLVLRTVSVEMISTAAEFIIPDTNTGAAAVASGNTRYFLPGARLTANATEGLGQISSKFAYTAKNLAVYLGAFAGTSGTARLRINSGNSSLSVSTTGTGIFEDTSNTQAVAVNDLLALSYAATGGSQTVTSFSVMGVSATVYNDSVSEALSLSDTQSALAIFASGVSESVSLTDSQSTTGSFGATVSEALALTETVSSAATFGSSIAETLSLADTVAAVGDMGVSLSESLNLSDTQSTTGSFSAAIGEGISLVDTVQIFVQPIPPTPSPQQGGGGSGSASGGHRRRDRQSRRTHQSDQRPDASLPRSTSEFEDALADIVREEDETDLCDVLTAFLQVKDRHR